ncbi:S8 family serine peptidase [Streptomyces violaceusniger]|uniref:Peptidase S8 and S53 subtilisin kexin sedolisin n=1 Tax=Streptomyces violaceusniger (strain Tu 4113) TaxID=653045 RepID=G2NTD6_STRV4|nr:S8 family serine peptidase [Streptomyces violaceusniger]AEM81784.1 peptidase S8 and S53 subtilisin kexin sedolisin [Streptomyces violaceusniger Tu 4113]
MPFKKYGARRRALSALAMLGTALLAVGGTAPAAAAQDISSQQWYLKDMQADDMWAVSKGEGVTVAVIDTGVDASLPELRGNVLAGKDASNTPTDPHQDATGHGTNMAALIAGSGAGGGIQGLAPQAKILPVKVVGDPKTDAPDPLMGRAIRYAVDHGSRILNVSFGTITGQRENFVKSQSAVNYALKKGALVFAAVGNNGDKNNLPGYPASLPGVVGVGAINQEGEVAKFSTHGDSVGLVALGDRIAERCEKNLDQTCVSGGTSQATAITSASAALIWSKHPKWTGNQVLRVMMQTAAKPKTGDVPSSYIGYGSVRPRKVLLDGEGDPGPANTNPLLAREGATKPKPSESASKAAGGASQPPASDEQAAEKPAAEAKASDDGGNTTLWVALGAGVVVVAGAAVAFTVVRRRGGTMARP